ncbi:hypothetical protein EVAR_89980_1 [Eumeta japonica]|uniref:Uncharacterized protein n=1 Tax=Eumeta variegata TaxID=151549 RepID=A0A4C2ACB9_EUMVA|nr:hypothetical protein EVAR_89980_1 [Eumeta japonica]
MVRGRLDIRPRDDARASTSSPPTADISLRKFQDRAPRTSHPSYHRSVVSTTTPNSRSRISAETRIRRRRARLCVRGGVIEIRTNNIFKRTTRKTISTNTSLRLEETRRPRETRRRRQLSNGTRARRERERVRNVAFVIYGRPRQEWSWMCSTDRNVRSEMSMFKCVLQFTL